MRIPRPRRYGPAARWYDVLSGERPVYRAGRVAAIRLLGLEPGDRVLDVGCGTGLNFPLLEDAVGRSGRIVGVDASPAMLERAEARIVSQGWTNVRTVHGDAGRLTALLTDADALDALSAFDAVLFTYSLSVIDRWAKTWSQAMALLRPSGRVAVVDLALPTGAWRVLSPLARLACLTGGADPHRHPWKLVASDLVDTSHLVLRGGHVHVAVGTSVAGHTRPGSARR